jgi:hypothetical protein
MSNILWCQRDQCESLKRYDHRSVNAQGADPPPPTSSNRGKAGRNHLIVEITPLLPTGIGELFSQTLSNLGHAALLPRCELPL